MCPIKPAFSCLSSEIRCTIQYIADFIDPTNVCHSWFWGYNCKFVIIFFAPTAKCCNSEASKYKALWHLPVWFCDCKIVWRQFFSAGQSESQTGLWTHHSTCSTDCLSEVFLSNMIISLVTEQYHIVRAWGKHNRITLYNVGVLSVKSRKQIYVDMLLLTRGCTFITHTHTHTQAAVKALDKSFILQIPAKTKARKVCHLEVLNAYKRKWGKGSYSHSTLHLFLFLCLPPLSFLLFLPLSVSPDSCHSLHTMDQDYYEGTDYLSPVPADGERTEEFEYEVGITLDTTADKSLTGLLVWPLSANLSLLLMHIGAYIGG